MDNAKLAEELVKLAKMLAADEPAAEETNEDVKMSQLKRIITPSNVGKLTPVAKKKISAVLPNAPMIRPERTRVIELLQLVADLIASV